MKKQSFWARIIGKVKSCWSWRSLNPLNWSNDEIKIFIGAFFAIMLPVYIFIGLQPTPSVDAAGYPQLEISSINLKTPVVTLELTGRQLVAPDTIAGVYSNAKNKLFVIGHSSTVFKKLEQIHVDDLIIYNNATYRVQDLKTLRKNDIDMKAILQAEEPETMIIMTCAGEPLPNQDATHRLIVTATRINLD